MSIIPAVIPNGCTTPKRKTPTESANNFFKISVFAARVTTAA
jgi:hypothetical protein